MSLQKKESVTVTYKDDKIIVRGKTIRAELAISATELGKVYWGSPGKGTLTLSSEEPQKK